METMPYTALIRFIVLLCVLFGAAITSTAGPQTPSWADEVQTYGMLPLTPQEASEFHVSVNGLWAGFGGADPILPFPPYISTVGKAYGTDAAAFADACHKAGLIVVCGINGIEGMAGIRERLGDWEAMACRDADGKTVLWGNPDEKCYIMCTNNPDWVNFEIAYGKEGIDHGADLILLDTPQSQAIANASCQCGYCDHCMAAFRAHLTSKYTPEQIKVQFGIDTLDNAVLVAHLRASAKPEGNELEYVNRATKNPLFDEYFRFQEAASFETRQALFNALRTYAASKGRQVAFSANTFNLSTVNPFGYWYRGLMFADLVDLFAYELSYCPTGLPFENTHAPRGKLAAYHRLAYSVLGRRSPAVMPAGSIGKMLKDVMGGSTMNAWMGVLTAEAYAANGAYTMYYFEAPPGNTQFKDKLWRDSIKIAGFVQAHKDLFEGPLSSGSPVAFLFQLNERGRCIPAAFPSYLGMAQGLTEGGYPFDVVFAGDGNYVSDRLSTKNLKPYKTLIIPSPIAPTENQEQVIGEFVRAGGTLVCHEPNRLGLSGEAKPVETPPFENAFSYGNGVVMTLRGTISDTAMDGDAGAHFLRDYDEPSRQELYAMAERLDLAPMLPHTGEGQVCAFPIAQPGQGRVIVHLVNYDVDYDTDAVRSISDLPVMLSACAYEGMEPPAMATIHAPGLDAPQMVEVTRTDKGVSCIVPKIDTMATVVFRANQN